jgi:transcriptional regulator with XRE-family HTH domain
VERIKAIRKAKGLSLSAVAAGAGLLPEAIARAERPEHDPRASAVAAIAAALGVPVSELFEEYRPHEHRRTRRTKGHV